MNRVLDIWLEEGFHEVHGTDSLWEISVYSVDWLSESEAETLAEASILTLMDLWMGSTVIISNRTGLSPQTILRWQEIADLIRVDGIGSESARLLVGAGINSVRELARCEIADVKARVEKALKKSPKLAKHKPGDKTIENWVKNALTINI